MTLICWVCIKGTKDKFALPLALVEKMDLNKIKTDEISFDLQKMFIVKDNKGKKIVVSTSIADIDPRDIEIIIQRRKKEKSHD